MFVSGETNKSFEVPVSFGRLGRLGVAQGVGGIRSQCPRKDVFEAFVALLYCAILRGVQVLSRLSREDLNGSPSYLNLVQNCPGLKPILRTISDSDQKDYRPKAPICAGRARASILRKGASTILAVAAHIDHMFKFKRAQHGEKAAPGSLRCLRLYRRPASKDT